MRIVNTYEDLRYPVTRFIINIYDTQSYKIVTSNLHKGISPTHIQFLLARNTIKLINKPNT